MQRRDADAVNIHSAAYQDVNIGFAFEESGFIEQKEKVAMTAKEARDARARDADAAICEPP
eukprot:9318620-Lingulodinium_polyedra.AAC.1